MLRFENKKNRLLSNSMDKQIELWKATITSDDYGRPVENLALVATVYAQKTNVNQYVETSLEERGINGSFNLFFRHPGVEFTHIKVDGEIMNIHELEDLDNKHVWVKALVYGTSV